MLPPSACTATIVTRDESGRALGGVALAVDGRPAATTDAAGRAQTRLPCGTHALDASRAGYRGAAGVRVDVRDGGTIVIGLPVAGNGALTTIAQVTVDGRLALSRSTVPAETISAQDAALQGDALAVDALARAASLTLVRPNAGGRGAVAVAALRGPDPSETTIALDGQVLNDTNTGDFDLSQLPLAGFSRFSITEGIGSETSAAANTIGGVIDLDTLEPSLVPHTAAALRLGAFDATQLSFTSTGTEHRLGYALALDDGQRDGIVHAFPAAFANGDTATTPLTLNSATGSHTLLGKLVYDAGDGTMFKLRYFTIHNHRDLSGVLDAPADSSQDVAGGRFVGPGVATSTQDLRALDFNAAAPLGSGTLEGDYAVSGSDVTYDGGTTASPYAISHQDDLATVSLGWRRSAGALALDLGGYFRNETLAESSAFGATQGERSLAAHVRADYAPVERLRVTGALYDTRYSTFGASVDGRIGLSFDLDARSVARFSVGTGFRAPLLAERYAAPADALLASVDANCVAPNGNPSLQPEHVTSYELGVGRRIGVSTTVDATVYHTNLRGPIELAYPLGTTCPVGPPVVAGEVVPINIGRAVYQGGTLRLAQQFARSAFLRLEYGLNAAYPLNLPAIVANPTSGANLIAGQQFQGIPLQTASATIAYTPGGFHAAASIIAKSKNNELNQGPYAYTTAALGYGTRRVDVTLAATNLTNAVAGRFTRLRAGVPYPTPSGPLPTDAFVLEPFGLSGILTLRL